MRPQTGIRPDSLSLHQEGRRAFFSEPCFPVPGRGQMQRPRHPEPRRKLIGEFVMGKTNRRAISKVFCDNPLPFKYAGSKGVSHWPFPESSAKDRVPNCIKPSTSCIVSTSSRIARGAQSASAFAVSPSGEYSPVLSKARYREGQTKVLPGLLLP